MTSRAGVHLRADVAVVGSGFGGALTALLLRRTGFRVALLERGHHPRFAIGESTTPLTNLLLEELADRYDLPRVRVFSKWGTWQQSRPDVAAGLKRGFSFMFHEPGEPFRDDSHRSRQLMVAASPNDDVADTHWYRPDFDLALVNEARDAGVEYFDDTDLESVREHDAGIELVGTRQGQPVVVDAAFVVDATGPRGFLARHVGIRDVAPRWLPPTQGLYTHFEGVDLWADTHPSAATPPYPSDAAALHHVFPDGWIWVLRFNNGITSAGAAITEPRARELSLADGQAAWSRLLDTLPSVHEQFARSRATQPFLHAPRVAYRCDRVVGQHWALLPSAAGVIDPLLSTGFPLTLLGIGRLVAVLSSTGHGPERQEALAAYAAITQAELDATEQLVAALYSCMNDPELFTRLSLLYFAAASFSETVRRLQRPALAPGFLMHAHPTFGPELRACATTAASAPVGASRAELFERIDRAIEPFDTAGLGDHSRNRWYPVLASDLISSAARLHASPVEVQQLLARCGLTAQQVS